MPGSVLEPAQLRRRTGQSARNGCFGRSPQPMSVRSWWTQSPASLAPVWDNSGEVPHSHPDVPSGIGSQLPTAVTHSPQIGFPLSLPHPPPHPSWNHLPHNILVPRFLSQGLFWGAPSVIPLARAVKSNIRCFHWTQVRLVHMALTRVGRAIPGLSLPTMHWTHQIPPCAKSPYSEVRSSCAWSSPSHLLLGNPAQVTYPLWSQLPHLGLEIKLVLTSVGCCTERMRKCSSRD